MKSSLIQDLEKNYLIDKEIGRGGMGVVYKATDKRLERPVAIKVLTLSGAENQDDSVVNEVIERFKREAKVVARLSHPNIVSIFDIGQVEDQYYMVMEFADGKPLSDLVAAKKPLPPALVTSIGVQICQALGYAHENNITHRDIKPANIILSPKGKAQLTDFGIAQLGTESTKLTQAGTMMGSIMYASPEQVQDASAVDSRSDIYSLGVTLYELYTGKIPYQSESVSQLLLEILSTSSMPPPLKASNPEIPDMLEILMQRAMSKDKNERYSSAQELGHDLSQLMSSEFQASNTNVAINIDFSGVGSASTQGPGQSTIMRRTKINQELIKGLEGQKSWVEQAIKDWKTENVSHMNLAQVMDKVMEPSLYGKGFSGALRIDEDIFTFIYDGYFVGGLCLKTGHTGHEVFAGLPEESDAISLYVLPEEQAHHALLIAGAASGRGKMVQKDLDSSLMDLIPLLDSLTSDEEQFTGYIKCLSQTNLYYYGFLKGQQIFATAANPESAESDTYLNLKDLILKESVLISIYEPKLQIFGPSIHKLLKESEVTFGYADPNKTTLQTLCDFGNKEVPLHLIKEAKENSQVTLKLNNTKPLDFLGQQVTPEQFVKDSRYMTFAHWYLKEYFYLLNSSDNTTSLKYIYSWIPAIQELNFYESHRGKDGKDYTFTLTARGQVSGEKNEKVLSLIRFGKGTAAEVESFINAVKEVKSALIKSGDIGGAIFVSEQPFETETLKYFYASTVETRKGGLGALDKLTKYKGFVRMGFNRGFHLNLIELNEKDQFEVIAPLLK